MREMYRPRANRYNDFIDRDADEIAQQFVDREKFERINKKNLVHQIPTLKDPKLFAVKCLIGSEREMALSVGNKYNALKGTADEIRIISVSALDKIPGYIYVEAINKYDAEFACKGFNKLRTRFINVRLIRL
jgi:transcription elongation factor SPT5